MIVGAGMAGLIAAHSLPDDIVERETADSRQQHRAVLRCRSNDLSELTGIPFTAVTIHKGIWFERRWVEPNMTVAALYSKKTLDGRLAERSIWNVTSEQRFLPPEDFWERLVENVQSRVSWGTSCDFLSVDEPIISTAPLWTTAARCGIGIPSTTAEQSHPITVVRHRVRNCALYQTAYFPDPEYPLYRATLHGSLLIQEFAGTFRCLSGVHPDVERAFRIDSYDYLDTTTQALGKIHTIDDTPRKALIHRLTDQFNIYSLGRFATWKPVMMDDLPHDITVIKRIMQMNQYDRTTMRGERQ